MQSLTETLPETIEILGQFATLLDNPEGPDEWSRIVVRDQVFKLLESLIRPAEWPVEMVEVMSIMDHYMQKGSLTMSEIIAVVEPDQLALMSEIIDAVDRSPEWGL